MSSLLECAQEYAAQGWPVFPCHDTYDGVCSCGRAECLENVKRWGKHPRTLNGLSDASRDATQIAKWWAQFPHANIGALTGASSGFTVIDLDGQEGLTSFMQHLKGVLPPTRRHRTPTGGYHLIYRYDPRIRNTVAFLPSVDARNDGGYILLPPSANHGREYEIVAMDAVAALPDDLPPCFDRPSSIVTTPEVPSTIPAGSRDATLSSLAGSMRRRGLEEEEIYVALLVVNQKRCTPPLPDSQVRKIAHSISRYAAADPINTGYGLDHLTDLHNARLVAGTIGDNVHFGEEWNKWVYWDGSRWKQNNGDMVVRLATEVLESQYQAAVAAMAAATGTTDAAKQFLTFAKGSLNLARINAAVTLLRSQPGISVPVALFDVDPWVLNCANGTLNLKTAVLSPHNPIDLLTKLCPVDYDSSAECPRFLQFLDEIFPDDLETRQFLQQGLGYSLCGVANQRTLFIPYGFGANGKSTVLTTFGKMLGDYARVTRAATFMVKRGDTIPDDLAALRGARFVPAVEAAENHVFSEDLVKQMTGSDVITARPLYGTWFDFEPQFKIWLATNHRPIIRSTDKAIWDRVCLIPFTVTIPDERQDRNLGEKLQAEWPGILAWAVQGCLIWQMHGRLIRPDPVLAASTDYRNDMDTVGTFLREMCEENGLFTASCGYLYERYQEWAKANGEFTLSNRRFSQSLKERGFTTLRDRNKFTFWQGLRLVTYGERALKSPETT